GHERTATPRIAHADRSVTIGVIPEPAPGAGLGAPERARRSPGRGARPSLLFATAAPEPGAEALDPGHPPAGQGFRTGQIKPQGELKRPRRYAQPIRRRAAVRRLSPQDQLERAVAAHHQRAVIADNLPGPAIAVVRRQPPGRERRRQGRGAEEDPVLL